VPLDEPAGPRRLVHLGVGAVITIATVLQAPGRLAADTKLDLAVDPVRFLGRATHLWQPDALGHVPNQIVGYLFPMGPFFVAGHAARVPMWLVQRAWIAAVLVLAYWGAVRVAARLGFDRPSTQALAGAAYALSPAMVAFVGSTSGGQLPAALLPWVLVPLMDGATGGSPRRAAARSALAVVAMGAVNATSTVAALPLAGLGLVTRRPGPRRRRLAAWWVGLVGLATVWWTVALAVQARYGFDFVPFTETARVTTATTSLVEVIRGTGHWLSLLRTSGPWLPAGWALASGAGAIAGTVAVAAAGMYGLARRDMPERTFLVAGVGLGAALIAVGYAGPLGSPLASTARSLLDDQLSALRNLHKFEPMLRLPLALGLAHAVATLPTTGWRAARRELTVVAAAAVFLAALPLVRGELLPRGAFDEVPAYWKQTAAWLAARDGRSLLLPASEFGEYRWGRPLDDPLQPLDAGPWAVRNLIPLGSTGATRVLDAISRRVETGRTAGLAEALDRAGLRYLVVRNDLDPLRSTAPRPSMLRAVLHDAPGLRRVAVFGPTAAARATSDRVRPGAAGLERTHAVEVYEVVGPQPSVRTLPAAGLLVVSGGPESAVDLTGVADNPAILAGDGDVPDDAPALLTDGLRLRDVDFGRVRDAVSYVLTPDERAPDTRAAPLDRTPVPGPDHATTAVMTGAATLRATSYGSRFDRTPESQPFAAFDRDDSTGWSPEAVRDGRGQAVQLTFDHPRPIRHVDIAPMRTPEWRTRVSEVVVTTEHGNRRARIDASGPTRVALPPGATRVLRVTIVRVEGPRLLGPALAEVTVPGLTITRPLRLPSDQLARLRAGAPLAGVRLVRSAADSFDATRHDEEPFIDRQVELPVSATLALGGTAVARPGPALDALVETLGTGAVRATASTVWGGLPAFRAGAVADGDRITAWVADPGDPAPELALTWDGARPIDAIVVRAAPGPFARPRRVRLSSGREQRDVFLDRQGRATFLPMETDRLRVTVLETAPVPAGTSGLVTPVATGIGEHELGGLASKSAAIADDTPVVLPCGRGPQVFINGLIHFTEVRGTAGDLLAGRALHVTGCDKALAVEPGRLSVRTNVDGPLVLDTLDLLTPVVPATPAPRPTRVVRWTDEHRRVHVGAGPAAYLTTNENANEGWHATIGGRALRPARLDGWRQAWLVPAGAGGDVDLDFRPARTYRAGLAAGAVGVLVTLALAGVGSRRRRTDHPPATARTVPVVVLVGTATLVVFLVAGPVALAVPLLALAGRDVRLPWLAGGLYAAAGALVALRPGQVPGSGSGAYGALAQLLAALALAALVISLVPAERR
jgi:arabinofuranan 3-O-arabinosyltransferase